MDIGAPELLIVTVLFAIGCGLLARSKGRNPAGWAALGLLFGPLALIVLALLRRRPGEVSAQ